MTFSEEQLKMLSTWEQHFNTAVKADWARNPGRTGLQTIASIFQAATGDNRRVNDNCNTCILRLLKDVGRVYFADKAEMEERQKVEVKDVEVKKARVRVKTKTKKA